MQKFLSRFLGSGEEAPAKPLVAPQFTPYLTQAHHAIVSQDWEAARSAYEAGLELAREHGDIHAQHFFLNGLGTVHYKVENYPAAEATLLNALALALRIGDPLRIAHTQINLAEVATVQGDTDRAKDYLEQALESARQSGELGVMTLALENLARIYIDQANPTYAIHLLREGIKIAQDAQDARAGASLLGLLGKAHLVKGDRPMGRRYLEQAQRLAMQTGREALALQWVMLLADTDLAEEDFASAIDRYQATEDLGRRIGRQPKTFYRDIALRLSIALRHMGYFAAAQTQAERALLHSQELGDQVATGQALASLGLALQGQGNYQAAAEKLAAVLDHYEQGILDNEAGKAGILLALGKSYLRLKRVEDAEAVFNQALELARQNDHPEREAEALHLLGSVKAAANQRQAAIEYWLSAIRLFEQQNEYPAAARALCDLGNLRRMQGDLSAATKNFEDALTYLSNVDDQVTRGLVLSTAANLYTQLGDMTTAEAFYQDSIQIAQSLNDKHSESIRLGNLAWFYVLTGRYSKAQELLEKALTISQQLGDHLLIAIQINNWGYGLARQGQHQAALERYQQAAAELETVDSDRWEAIIQSNQGASLVELGRLDEAEPLYEAALSIMTEVDDRENLIRTRHRLGNLRFKQGRLEEARQLAETAYDEARRMGYRKGQADAGRVLGDLYAQQGDASTAAQYYAEAHKLYKIISDPLADKYAQYAVGK